MLPDDPPITTETGKQRTSDITELQHISDSLEHAIVQQLALPDAASAFALDSQYQVVCSLVEPAGSRYSSAPYQAHPALRSIVAAWRLGEARDADAAGADAADGSAQLDVGPRILSAAARARAQRMAGGGLRALVLFREVVAGLARDDV